MGSGTSDSGSLLSVAFQTSTQKTNALLTTVHETIALQTIAVPKKTGMPEP